MPPRGPNGVIRGPLLKAFEELAPCTWRDVVPAAPINPACPAEVMLVRRTVENMVRAGDLVSVGFTKAEGSRVWQALYEPASQGPDEPCESQMREDSLRAIGVVTNAWGCGVK